MSPKSTPVLVGVGVVSQREDDPREALDAASLMVEASRRAAEDAGSRELLSKLGRVGVPRGSWSHPDPGRLVAESLGAAGARSVLAEIGVLQQTLLTDACRAIVEGETEVALVTGGDAKYRSLQAQIQGVELRDSQQTGVSPDVVWRPTDSLWADLEWQRGLHMPVSYYSVIENALRFAQGVGVEEHRDELARLYADFNRVAVANPDAWNRTPVAAREIRDASSRNPMLAFPYTKLHNSSWNVDQAAGLLFCSTEAAERYGIPRERWIHPRSAAESNHMIDVSRRAELHRCPGLAIAGGRALGDAGVDAGALDHLELYSCFPSAVRIAALELGVSLERTLTVTGGMPFAGGPLNNFAFQATVRMAQILREEPGATGLVSSISGLLTKQGFGVWSSAPAETGFRWADVSEEVASRTATVELVDDYRGSARVAGYTVLYRDGAPARGIAVCDLPDGRRTVAATEDVARSEEMTQGEFCGRAVAVGEGGGLSF